MVAVLWPNCCFTVPNNYQLQQLSNSCNERQQQQATAPPPSPHQQHAGEGCIRICVTSHTRSHVTISTTKKEYRFAVSSGLKTILRPLTPKSLIYLLYLIPLVCTKNHFSTPAKSRNRRCFRHKLPAALGEGQGWVARGKRRGKDAGKMASEGAGMQVM
jgi:hypothetical protein